MGMEGLVGAGRLRIGDSVVGSVGRARDFPRGPVHGQTNEVVTQTAPIT